MKDSWVIPTMNTETYCTNFDVKGKSINFYHCLLKTLKSFRTSVCVCVGSFPKFSVKFKENNVNSLKFQFPESCGCAQSVFLNM